MNGAYFYLDLSLLQYSSRILLFCHGTWFRIEPQIDTYIWTEFGLHCSVLADSEKVLSNYWTSVPLSAALVEFFAFIQFAQRRTMQIELRISPITIPHCRVSTFNHHLIAKVTGRFTQTCEWLLVGYLARHWCMKTKE